MGFGRDVAVHSSDVRCVVEALVLKACKQYACKKFYCC
jgi:hypothetical protein